MSTKSRRRLSGNDSAAICASFKEYHGNWPAVFSDKEIKKIMQKNDIDEDFVKGHINNKKKKVKSASTARSTNSGIIFCSDLIIRLLC